MTQKIEHTHTHAFFPYYASPPQQQPPNVKHISCVLCGAGRSGRSWRRWRIAWPRTCPCTTYYFGIYMSEKYCMVYYKYFFLRGRGPAHVRVFYFILINMCLKNIVLSGIQLIFVSEGMYNATRCCTSSPSNSIYTI